MQKILFFFSLFFCTILFGQKKFQKNNEYHFYENKGQIVDQNGNENKDVKYLFHSAGLNVQLRSNGFSYDVYETVKKNNPNFRKKADNELPEKLAYLNREFNYEKLIHRIDIEFLNSNKNATIITQGKSSDYENYFNLEHNPDGITNVHRYQKIIYKNIYNAIDLIFFKPNDTLKPVEYNFIINPGGKISDIKMKFYGAPTLLKEGKLMMNLRFGDLYEKIPNSWIQDRNKKDITVTFKDFGNQTFGFTSPLNSSNKKIIIDPVPTRIWGSYAGGFGEDYGEAKTDIQNNVYLYGATASTTNIATSGASQTNITNSYFDAYVMKITSNGQKLWGTYYGDIRDDNFSSIDFDENLNVYAAGVKFKTTSANDVVMVKFSSNGTLVLQKNLGGNSSDICYSVSYNNNYIYLAGQTNSFDFPVLNAFQPTKLSQSGSSDGFLTALDSLGNIVWSTYLGGNNSTSLHNIFSSTNDLEILGLTTSQSIVMINPFQSTNSGVTDILYLKFSKTGNLLRSSYAGLENQDVTYDARIINNTLVIPGHYFSLAQGINNPGVFRVDLATNVVTKNYYSPLPTFQLLSYVDKHGNIFFTGLSNGWQPDIATPNAYLSQIGPYSHTFLVKYNSNNVKEWGTFYGGNGGTQLGQVTKDNNDYIYFTGMSSNNTTGIATPGTFQQTGGHPSNDVFIAKFQDCTSTGMVNSNSPVCNNSNIQLSATGGTTYVWTGPNGFTSNLQNPTIPNATAANAGTYTCQITGSGACDGSFTVNVVVGDNVPPLPIIASLPNITGDCNTTISTFPTATDNCAGTVTATTTDPLSYSTPGTHIIHWTYNDGNGNTATQNQNVVISATATPITANTSQTFCATNQPKISDIQITGQNIKWYDTANNILPVNTPLVNGQTYFASQTINGCESTKISIQVIVNNTPKPTAALTQDFCASSNPKLSNLAVTGTTLIYYDSTGNILPPNTPLVHGQTYFVTQTLNNCESEKLGISVTLSQNNVPANNYRASVCNTSTGNTMTVDLTSYQGNLIANPANYIFIYTDQLGNPIVNPSNHILIIGTNIINVKVSTVDGCFKNVILELNLNPKPIVTLPEDFDFCKGKTVILDAGSGFAAYLWNTGATTQTISVSTPGIYWVKVTNSFGCENTDSIQLTYSVLGEIVSVNISNNSATVIMSSPGNYEYSLDNQNWQNSNVFSNLTLGEYKVYVRTKSGCIIGEKNFSIFNIPNMITPNGDGTNDKWRIAGLENYSGTEILVYDRKGLIVFKQTITKKPFEWDGKYNSNPLATGNYWYTIKVSDGRVYNGWLLIKNRN